MSVTITLTAKPVDVSKAQETAQRFTESKIQSGLRGAPTNLSLVYTGTKNASQTRAATNPQYYVFNINDNEGFIIVSADDAARPILGYSTNSGYDKNNIPPNFANWMSFLQEEIAYAQDNNLPQSAEAKQEWENAPSANARGLRAVSPMLKTQWSQYSPYNNMCPIPENQSGRALAGCGLIATSQLMKFHNYPAKGQGVSPAYNDTYHSQKFSVASVNFGATTYDWANMLNSYTGTSTEAQKNAVATLVAHVGAGSKALYSTAGSGSQPWDIPVALVKYYKYDRSIRRFQRESYNNSAWEAMLKAELDAGRPMYYDGSGSGGGHAFVCDGYTDDGRFHFNFGWGGAQDGNYLTTALIPYTSTPFNNGQSIIINIMPDKGGAGAFNGYAVDLLTFSSDKNKANHNETFKVSVKFKNASCLDTFPGAKVNIAIVDNNDNIVALAGESYTQGGNTYSIESSKLSKEWFPTYDSWTLTVNCKVPATSPEGQYNLRFVTRADNESSWKIATIGNPSALPFQVGSNTYTNAQVPSISTQPKSANVDKNATYSLNVSASVTDGGILSYQWYSNTYSGPDLVGTAISGATSASYAVPTGTNGTVYYYVLVTNTNNNVNGAKTATHKSDVVAVTVSEASQTVTITIHSQPLATTTVTQGVITQSLTVEASASGGASLSYQWYGYNGGWVKIDGATSASYKLPTDLSVGEHYYYCNVDAKVNNTSVVHKNIGTLTVDVLKAVEYSVTVVSGTGSGNYFPGNTVTIKANAAPAGKDFHMWESEDGIVFDNERSAQTTFKMPEKAITVNATYSVKYSVTVNDGEGGGNYFPGDIVTIKANPAGANNVFYMWESEEDIAFGDMFSEETFFEMPMSNITINATYTTDVAVIKPEKSEKKAGILQGKAVVSSAAQWKVILPDGKKVSHMKAVIFDNVGNVVFEAESGNNDKISWDLANLSGRTVANGAYLLVVEAKNANGKTYPFTTKFGVRR
ncbi:MAG: C10 family peptidase [Chitinispirillales bacterium]|nr:C10 family peptidase [Chitinispirillales bacterium]